MKKIVMTVLAAMSFSLVSANIENNNGVAKREYQLLLVLMLSVEHSISVQNK